MLVFILILILSTLLAFICIFAKYPIIETMLIYDVDIDDKEISINWDDYNFSKTSLKQFENIPFIAFNKNNTDPLYITDMFTYKQLRDKTEIFRVLNDQKTLLLLKKRDSESYEQFENTRKKNVGCPTPVHEKLFRILCKTFKLSENNFNIIKESDINKIDILVYYESMNNPRERLPQQIDFVAYDNINKDNIKYFIPYCRIINHPLDKYFKEYYDPFPVKKCIQIDMILHGKSNTKFEKIKDPKYNFLTIFEHFQQEEDPIIVNTKFNVPGTLWNDKFYLDKDEIEGIPLLKNMLVNMTLQNNVKENGKYKVTDNTKIIARKNISKLTPQCIDATMDGNTCPTFFDKPCEFDEECPFFSEKNIGIGGCRNGLCDMPVGVERIAFTKYKGEPYDKTVFPLK